MSIFGSSFRLCVVAKFIPLLLLLAGVVGIVVVVVVVVVVVGLVVDGSALKKNMVKPI